MNDALWEHMRQRYLQRNALTGEWELEGLEHYSRQRFEIVVIIPALAEGSELFATLDSIARNDVSALEKVLVIVVVNQPCDAANHIIQQNRNDLEHLPRYAHANPHLNLAWIDAAGACTCLPPKRGGVGMARKIGADLILPHIKAQTLLVHLDADTRVCANYAATLRGYVNRGDFHAGVISFSHEPCINPVQQSAIEDYELYMRCHAAGLNWAGSPYAYPSIGSTMLSSAYAYVLCGGMNMRKAGEDFYFLQQLAKSGSIEHIDATRVFPAARISTRTPFGTGQNLLNACNMDEALQLFYPLECYAVLRTWLELVTNYPQSGAAELLSALKHTSQTGEKFVCSAGFEHVWGQLQSNHKHTQRRIKAFHEWFDALKSWQLIRTLGEEIGAPWSARDAIQDFIPLLGIEQVPQRYHNMECKR